MLATVEDCGAVPSLTKLTAAFLNRLLLGADVAVKRYCKQRLELGNYVQFFSGARERQLVLKEVPAWVGQTTIASGSDGAQLPQSTINVTSTVGLPPGTGGNPVAQPVTVAVQLPAGSNASGFTAVTYTGTTATTLTGCSGGSGTLRAGNRVVTPCAWEDPNGYYGQFPNGFSDGTILTLGSNFVLEVDEDLGQKSKRALLRRVGGAGASWVGLYPEAFYRGKLAGHRLPNWPLGDGNIKVAYTAGHFPVPADLVNACVMLVAQTARVLPGGTNLSSESLGAYSYSTLVNGDNPELGDLRRTLAPYRDSTI